VLLSLAPLGEINRIKAIWCDEETRNFLEVLGFLIDTEVIVKSKLYDDSFIIYVGNKRMAIGEELARKIIVGP